MNNKKIKSYSVTATIILLIVFLLFFNYYYFFLSPSMVEVHKVEDTVKLFEKNNDLEIEFESKYYGDKEYYTGSDSDNFYLFNNYGRLLKEIKHSEIDFNQVENIANNEVSDFEISLALYDEELVYVIKSKSYDIFIDTEFNEVLRFKKGIVND